MATDGLGQPEVVRLLFTSRDLTADEKSGTKAGPNLYSGPTLLCLIAFCLVSYLSVRRHHPALLFSTTTRWTLDSPRRKRNVA